MLPGSLEHPVHRAARTSRETAWATATIIALVILAPGLEVLLGHRNLMIEDYLPTLTADESQIMHYATAASVLCSLLVIGLCLASGRTHLTSLTVAGALLAYYTTNVILPAGLGAVPYVSRSHAYAFIIFFALYLSRDDGPSVVIAAARNSLLVFMVASLVCLFVAPELTRRIYEPEVRLPFIDFRFWGLAAGPNQIAPMALQLALFTLHQPFQRPWLDALSYVAAFAVVLLAQSQTTWVIFIILLPLFLLYRSGRLDLMPRKLSPAVLAVAAPLILLGVFAVVAVLLALPSVGSDDADGISLSGRTDVWNVAWDLFSRHPVFGYGHAAWQDEFRESIRMSWAFHAHNQLLQSLSVGGIIGGIGLIVYVGVLLKASIAAAAETRGLAPALLAIILVRSITETPLDMGAALLGESVIHLVLFRLLTSLDGR